MNVFNSRLKQVVFLALIILLFAVIILELSAFLPGLLGALALYMSSRSRYFHLVYHKKWRPGWTAGLFLLLFLIIIGIPIYIAVVLIKPKVGSLFTNPEEMVTSLQQGVDVIENKIGFQLLSENTLNDVLNKVTAFLPGLVNSTTNLVTNIAIMLFVLYYMYIAGKTIERELNRITPLKQENINMLTQESKRVIKSNVLGIPLISCLQGVTGALGYFIFGVEDWALWGFLTGIFAFFPVVGTMLAWVPLVILLYAKGDSATATWVLLYSVVVTGNVDYLFRITLLRKLGDVHPVITIIGVLVGLNLFGFIGLIFGPLLVSYIIVLCKIYMNEFTPESHQLSEKASDSLS